MNPDAHIDDLDRASGVWDEEFPPADCTCTKDEACKACRDWLEIHQDHLTCNQIANATDEQVQHVRVVADVIVLALFIFAAVLFVAAFQGGRP